MHIKEQVYEPVVVSLSLLSRTLTVSPFVSRSRLHTRNTPMMSAARAYACGFYFGNQVFTGQLYGSVKGKEQHRRRDINIFRSKGMWQR